MADVSLVKKAPIVKRFLKTEQRDLFKKITVVVEHFSSNTKKNSSFSHLKNIIKLWLLKILNHLCPNPVSLYQFIAWKHKYGVQRSLDAWPSNCSLTKICFRKISFENYNSTDFYSQNKIFGIFSSTRRHFLVVFALSKAAPCKYLRSLKPLVEPDDRFLAKFFFTARLWWNITMI